MDIMEKEQISSRRERTSSISTAAPHFDSIPTALNKTQRVRSVFLPCTAGITTKESACGDVLMNDRYGITLGEVH